MSETLLPPVKSVLFDMLSTVRPVSDQAFAALSQDDWRAMGKIVKQHRLGPMLDHRYHERGQAWPIPADVKTEWAAAARHSAMRALRIQATLMQIAECLSPMGIEFLVLKGGWLAWHAYPHPGLRPMRDLDLLVGPQDALRVQSALLEMGFEGTADSLAVSYAIQHEKHLPPIRSSTHGINVEIHLRLYHSGTGPDDSDNYISDLIKRKITKPLGGFNISYLSATDALLHLIVHAAYDHHFNNGPVLIDDIAHILDNYEIDWDLFWHLVKKFSWVNGCFLSFSLAEYQHGIRSIKWMEEGHYPVPFEIIDHAKQLCLQEFSERKTTAFFSNVMTAHGISGLVALIRYRLLIPRTVLAEFSGLSLHNPLLWLAYPIWLSARIYRAFTSLFSRTVRNSAAHHTKVSEWLATRR